MLDRIVFRDVNGVLRWFDRREVLFTCSWTMDGGPFGSFSAEHIALLPGDRWVLYGRPDTLDPAELWQVTFTTAEEALDWLLPRGHEIPPCLELALQLRNVVQPTDTPNPNLLRVCDADNGEKLVVLDIAGASKWGPWSATVGENDSWDGIPTWFTEDCLYRLASGQFVLYRERTHREAESPADPLVMRMPEERAAKWLMLRGFDPPEDVAHFAECLKFKAVHEPTTTGEKEETSDAGRADSENGQNGLDWEAKCLGLLAKHPGWTDTRIAEEAEIHRTQLYRSETFKAARKLQRSASSVPSGSKNKETGMVEAWDNLSRGAEQSLTVRQLL